MSFRKKTISWVLNFAVRFRLHGNSIPGELTRRVRVQIGEKGTINVRSARETYAGGQIHVLKRQSAYVIGQPGKSSEDESGLWLFENNVLRSFVVLGVGAASNVITLKKTAAGLSCTADGPPMQEVGAGPMKSIGRTKTERIEVLSMKLLSSTCNVQATELVKDNDGFWATRAKPKLVGNCTSCLTRCAECGMSEGSVCFQACRANGNPMVRSDSICRQRFVACGR
jgi:hypothetical protein